MKKTIFLLIGMVAFFAVNAFSMDIEALIPMLKEAKEGITTVFTSIDNGLSTTARKLSNVDLKGDDARKILNDLCKGRDYLIDCSIIDTAGKMIVVEPAEYSKYEGSDISKQTHIIDMLKNKKPVFSNAFHSVEGIEAVDFDYPIFSDKGDFLGAVSMLIKQDALSADIIMPLVQGMACKAWIMQKNGMIIYDPDPNQIGKNIFVDPFFQPFGDLVSFSGTVAMAKSGAGSYDFYVKGMEDQTVVKKYAVWDTVSLYGTQWRIIVMEVDDQPAIKKDTVNTKK
ncbi:MAG: cache domain-containing protein [Candidatus Omnitrophota bacterium]